MASCVLHCAQGTACPRRVASLVEIGASATAYAYEYASHTLHEHRSRNQHEWVLLFLSSLLLHIVEY